MSPDVVHSVVRGRRGRGSIARRRIARSEARDIHRGCRGVRGRPVRHGLRTFGVATLLRFCGSRVGDEAHAFFGWSSRRAADLISQSGIIAARSPAGLIAAVSPAGVDSLDLADAALPDNCRSADPTECQMFSVLGVETGLSFFISSLVAGVDSCHSPPGLHVHLDVLLESGLLHGPAASGPQFCHRPPGLHVPISPIFRLMGACYRWMKVPQDVLTQYDIHTYEINKYISFFVLAPYARGLSPTLQGKVGPCSRKFRRIAGQAAGFDNDIANATDRQRMFRNNNAFNQSMGDSALVFWRTVQTFPA